MGVMTVSSQNFMEIDMPGWWLSGASVDLDFRNGRYYDSSNILAGLSNLLSISRASIGYAQTSGGTLTQFASGQFRQTDLGLLIEDARTNYVIQSQNINNGIANWNGVHSGDTETQDTTIAPDGTTTADSIALTSTGFIYTSTSPPAGTNTYTFSAYVQGNVGDKIVLRMTGDSTGDINQLFTLTSSWARYSITGSLGVTSAANCGFDNRTIVGGDGVAKTIIAWGVQLEVASFASSYIPTTTTSATRAADNVTIVGSLQTVLASSAGSLVTNLPTIFTASGIGEIVRDLGNSKNILYLDTGVNIYHSDDASSDLTFSNSPNAPGKAGVSWDGSGRSLVANGGTVATNVNLMTQTSTLCLGSQGGTGNSLNSYFQRLTVWNSRLADATLQALTKP